MYSLVEMMTYRRPEGSKTQRKFCRRFLEPTFGKPDAFGNYIHIIGDKPNLCFTAHHDTVHRQGGLQKLIVTNDVLSVSNNADSNCLGADCTTGIWLMLGMIEHGIEGVYVVHAAEESGCQGSSSLIVSNPEWLQQLDAVISFDRYGQKSIITHQMGMRTASDAFAESFASVVKMPLLKPDSGGSYTDSNEYAQIVSECTNISVGYYNQHTKNEIQDLDYADDLLVALVNADWSGLVFERDPSVVDDLWRGTDKYGYNYGKDDENIDGLERLVIDYPHRVAEMLDQYGFTPQQLMEECQIDDMSHYYNYNDNYAYRVGKKYLY
tara:strand:- start:1208 stop:2176 length:969 start_codon:yes stop_codon:yes gene_type:complete